MSEGQKPGCWTWAHQLPPLQVTGTGHSRDLQRAACTKQAPNSYNKKQSLHPLLIKIHSAIERAFCFQINSAYLRNVSRGPLPNQEKGLRKCALKLFCQRVGDCPTCLRGQSNPDWRTACMCIQAAPVQRMLPKNGFLTGPGSSCKTFLAAGENLLGQLQRVREASSSHGAVAPSLWRKQKWYKQKLSSAFAVGAFASYRMEQNIDSLIS